MQSSSAATGAVCGSSAEMREALDSRHLGRIIRAYRHHRFHGPGPLPQEVVAGWMGLTQTQLSRIETGKPVSDLDKLTLWAQTLGMPQRYLWFDLPGESRTGLVCVSPHDPSGLEPLTANSPVDEVYLEGSRLPSSELDDVLAIVPAPRLSPATIKALEASITDFWKRDDQYGSEALRPAVVAQLRHVLRLLTECRREDQRRSLIGIAAEFARLAGWMFFDACQYRTAHTYFEQSLRLIRESDDRPFIANVLACLSRQATYEAKPADALVLARAAQDACRSVATPRVMAVLSMREAFAHAVLDDQAGCRTAISQSHTSFETFWLASTHLQAGDLDEACGKGTGVLELAASVDSARIVGHIQELQRALTPFEREQTTKDFNERAAEFFRDYDLASL